MGIGGGHLLSVSARAGNFTPVKSVTGNEKTPVVKSHKVTGALSPCQDHLTDANVAARAPTHPPHTVTNG